MSNFQATFTINLSNCCSGGFMVFGNYSLAATIQVDATQPIRTVRRPYTFSYCLQNVLWQIQQFATIFNLLNRKAITNEQITK